VGSDAKPLAPRRLNLKVLGDQEFRGLFDEPAQTDVLNCMVCDKAFQQLALSSSLPTLTLKGVGGVKPSAWRLANAAIKIS
jgi:hypothetical protein